MYWRSAGKREPPGGAVFPLSAAQAFRLKKRTVASAIRWKAA